MYTISWNFRKPTNNIKKNWMHKKKKITYTRKTTFKSDSYKQHWILENNGKTTPKFWWKVTLQLESYIQSKGENIFPLCKTAYCSRTLSENITREYTAARIKKKQRGSYGT